MCVCVFVCVYMMCMCVCMHAYTSLCIQGQQLKEAQNINKSLSALGDCIQSLVAKSKHVPFRNSKLTFFLQDSLAGDSKVLSYIHDS